MEAQNKKHSLKHRVFEIIQIGNRSDIPSRTFDYLITAMIIINIVAMFMDTFDSLARFDTLLHFIEVFTVSIFIIEYLLRLWTAVYLYPERGPVSAALHFVRSFDGVIDLLTILPFFFLSGFVVFRMLRVVRILRLFQINSTFDSFNVITTVLYDKRRQLGSSIFIILMLMLASSLCMYSAEHAAQPENFKNALSGIWWSVSTLLTVGYGDIYPITAAGKIIACIITFLGVGVVAIPTGIISAGFVEQYTQMSKEDDSSGLNLQTIVIDRDSAWLDKTIEEIDEQYGYAIVLCKRGTSSFLPSKTDDFYIQVGDCVVAYKHYIEHNQTMNA